jgi:hypothetical protein
MFGLDLAVPLVDNELAKLGGLGEMPSLPDGIYLFSEDLTSGGTVLFDLPTIPGRRHPVFLPRHGFTSPGSRGWSIEM